PESSPLSLHDALPISIDRLPFASPADPLVAARIDALKKRDIEAFSAYQVPQAAIALRQGFGRLIRGRGDRGIVAVLDKRIVTKGDRKSTRLNSSHVKI